MFLQIDSKLVYLAVGERWEVIRTTQNCCGVEARISAAVLSGAQAPDKQAHILAEIWNTGFHGDSENSLAFSSQISHLTFPGLFRICKSVFLASPPSSWNNLSLSTPFREDS